LKEGQRDPFDGVSVSHSIPILPSAFYTLCQIGGKNSYENVKNFHQTYQNIGLLNDVEENGDTALHGACMWNRYDVVRYLCSEGANVFCLNSDLNNALHVMYLLYLIVPKRLKN